MTDLNERLKNILGTDFFTSFQIVISNVTNRFTEQQLTDFSYACVGYEANPCLFGLEDIKGGEPVTRSNLRSLTFILCDTTLPLLQASSESSWFSIQLSILRRDGSNFASFVKESVMLSHPCVVGCIETNKTLFTVLVNKE